MLKSFKELKVWEKVTCSFFEGIQIETSILVAGDLGVYRGGGIGCNRAGHRRDERMLKALIKT